MILDMRYLKITKVWSDIYCLEKYFRKDAWQVILRMKFIPNFISL